MPGDKVAGSELVKQDFWSNVPSICFDFNSYYLFLARGYGRLRLTHLEVTKDFAEALGIAQQGKFIQYQRLKIHKMELAQKGALLQHLPTGVAHNPQNPCASHLIGVL